MKPQEETMQNEKTTVQVSRTIRYVLELLQGRYATTSMNSALLEYFEDKDPQLLEGAYQIEKIVNQEDGLGRVE
jgi:predicted transcriptional regulator